jgi:hypothetical protein
MQITPVAQENITSQVVTATQNQEPKPVQAPDQKKPQEAPKDNVTLSQAAVDLAAQVPGKAVQETTNKSPLVEGFANTTR